MPIGDLLASIEGKPPVPSSTARARPGNGIPAKRKADDDARASEQKQPRLAPNANGPARSNVDAPKASRPADRPSSGYTGSARPSTAAANNNNNKNNNNNNNNNNSSSSSSSSNNNKPRPLTDKPASAASKKPSSTATGKPSPTTASFSTAGRTATSTNSSFSRPAPVPKSAGHDAAVGSTAKAPKKGSYAEIKARAAAQAQKLQTIGKIQHRAVEKQSAKKEQDLEDARLAKKGVKPGSKPVSGVPPKDGTHPNGNGLPDRGSKALGQKGGAGKMGSRRPAAVEERKPKKAALATTGYSGSARPPPSKAKPGAAKSSDGRDRARPPNPLGMFSRPRRKDDEYDEDMDDFIDDDEDEPEDDGYGRQYRYADEDDDSDMEAGYSDVEDEEAAAARLARLEDQREEAILEQRRREKEARKRATTGR